MNIRQKQRNDAKKKRRKKKTALIICRDRKQFWTTQTQFWQWVREGAIVKTGDHPLTGLFARDHEELMVAGEQASQRMIAGLHNCSFAHPLPELGLGRPKLLSIATNDQCRLLFAALLFRIVPLLL